MRISDWSSDVCSSDLWAANVIHHSGWRRRPAWMASSYSQDLRDRVIDAVEVEGMSRRAAARRFGVSEASAIKWVQRYRRTGSRRPVGPGGHRRSVLTPEREIGRAAGGERVGQYV